MELTSTTQLSISRPVGPPPTGLVVRHVVGRTTLIVMIFLSGCLISGCHRSTIRASRLPRDLQAKVRHRSGAVDLTRFSSPGVSDSLVGPRDLLKVTVASGRADEKPSPALVRVGNNGSVEIPLIGSVHVAGMEAHDASQMIVAAAVDGGIYVQPYVTVEIESKAVRSVTVLGAVNHPGVHDLPYENCSLVTALAAAGGLTDEAGTEVQIIRQPTLGLAANQSLHGVKLNELGDKVELAAYQPRDDSQSTSSGPLHTGQPQIIHLNLAEGFSNPSVDTRLGDRDIVKISPRTKEFIFVTGLVAKPGQFEMPIDQDVHLLDAIAMAGGKSSSVADKVLIIRRESELSQPVVIASSLIKAKKSGIENIRLAAGDTISIEQTPATVVVDAFNKLFRVTVGLAGRTTVF